MVETPPDNQFLPMPDDDDNLSDDNNLLEHLQKIGSGLLILIVVLGSILVSTGVVTLFFLGLLGLTNAFEPIMDAMMLDLIGDEAFVQDIYDSSQRLSGYVIATTYSIVTVVSSLWTASQVIGLTVFNSIVARVFGHNRPLEQQKKIESLKRENERLRNDDQKQQNELEKLREEKKALKALNEKLRRLEQGQSNDDDDNLADYDDDNASQQARGQ